MTIKKRPKRHDPERHVALRCNRMRCCRVETFPSTTTFEVVTEWAAKHDWRTIHRGGHLWDHWCPECCRLDRAPAEYWNRLHA